MQTIQKATKQAVAQKWKTGQRAGQISRPEMANRLSSFPQMKLIEYKYLIINYLQNRSNEET
jgi:hypothetical protein